MDEQTAPRSSSKLDWRFMSLVGFEVLDKLGFDPAEYLKRHPDLASLRLSHIDAKAHYLGHGLFERRAAPFSGSLAQVHEVLAASQLTGDQKEALSRSLALSRALELNDLSQIPAALVPGLGYSPVLACGDSHISLFTRANYKERQDFVFVPFCCWGASARGLPKVISRLNYGATILSVLKDCVEPMRASRAPLLLMFGQNDIEFVYHFKRAASGDRRFDQKHFETFCIETKQFYMRFIEQIRSVVPHSPVIVAGIMPPTLSDEFVFGNQKATVDLAWANDVEDYSQLREPLSHLEMPDWHHRTEMHRFFNSQLCAACEESRLAFLDIFDLCLSSNGIVSKPFILGQDGKDHHLDFYSFYTDLLSGEACRQLRRLLQLDTRNNFELRVESRSSE